MDELRLSAVATRVVAWHNRHPLARRISASQVHAIGYVALPFAGGAPTAEPLLEAPPQDQAPAGGTLRERAQQRARQKQEQTPERKPSPAGAPDEVPTVVDLAIDRRKLKPDFSEDFIDPLSPREVARFALRHGLALARTPADGPLRRVRADGAGGGTLLYLLTAVIETGTRKSRVLIGAGGDRPAVLGRRVLGRQRVAAAVLPVAASAAVAAWWLQPLALVPRAAAPMAMAPAPAASAAVAAGPASAAQASVPASAPASAATLVAAASTHAPASASSAPPASAPAGAASAALAAASAPPGQAPDAEPHLGKIDLPSIRPHFADSLRKHPPPPGPAAPAAPGTTPPGGPPVAVARAPEAPAHAPAFAVSSRLLRTRAEADQVRVAMKSLLAAVSANGVKVDVLPEGEDFRVVGMPFANRAAADQARALLVSRGMRVEVLAF